jgi:hypothetical protein
VANTGIYYRLDFFNAKTATAMLATGNKVTQLEVKIIGFKNF